jgi:hypothetical protein
MSNAEHSSCGSRLLVGGQETSGVNALPSYSEATRELVKLAGEVARDELITPSRLSLKI